MELVVVDASVAAKWVLTEPETGVALELLSEGVRCAAPEIIRLEVTGAVIRRLRTDAMTPDQAKAACDDWGDLIANSFVSLLSTEELFKRSVDIAFVLRHSLPDCLYLAAAEILDCRLITADRKLFERGKRVHDNIELLARAA